MTGVFTTQITDGNFHLYTTSRKWQPQGQITENHIDFLVGIVNILPL